MTNLQPHTVCTVSNCFGTLIGGHYTSYCRPSRGNVRHSCDDRSVSRLRTPVKTSAAYLFYNSLQNVRVLLLVPMYVHILLGWVGNCLLSLGWGCWVGRDGGLMPGLSWGWWMAVLQQTNVGCLSVLFFSLYFSYPFCPCISHTIGLIVSLPSFPYIVCPLFPIITTLVLPRPDAEGCCSLSHPVAGC